MLTTKITKKIFLNNVQIDDIIVIITSIILFMNSKLNYSKNTLGKNLGCFLGEFLFLKIVIWCVIWHKV